MHTFIGHQGQYAAQATRPAAEPLLFAGSIGLFEPAKGTPRDIAVLIATSFGVEDLCSRRFIRLIAESLGDRGIASLRFDYPGTGDALTDNTSAADFESWTGSLHLAASQLRQQSGCERIVIVAQGIGAPVAIASNIPSLAAMVLLAPVTSGRTHVRELSAFLSISVEKLSLRPDSEADAIAQVTLPPGVATGLISINLLKLEAPPAEKILVLARQERAADTQLAEHLQMLGAEVTTKPFEGYDRLTANPLLAEVPQAIVRQVTDWIAALTTILPDIRRDTPQVPSACISHTGDGYRETPLRFGRNNRLLGITCDPAQGPDATKAQVLLLAAGYERQAGWGSYSARLARDLARRGVSTLRFDCSNVADSPAVEGHEGHVIYTDIQVTDVWEAVDFLENRGATSIVAAGRCTGAYLAFQSCLRDPRLKGMVGINPEMFLWPENRPIVSALTEQTQTLKHYGSRFLDLKTLKKALRGEINLARKGRAIGLRLKQHAMRPLSKAVGGISNRERAVYAAFADLQRRNVPVTILYSPDDIGLEEHAHFFGRGKNRYPTITPRTVTGTSHTFQHSHARAAYIDAIVGLVETCPAEPPA
ncbi:alpha/beta hydrolase [Rhizobiales bacterium RZME27]|uniref:Alpha/beta hydrolase n=1 Tax=Endobacterium cereale TaxID=2663029 RepID=A0A6A8ADE7_9HYPH|nr:alpha/beta hydrolase [Endobacterium cereale]MEB2847779.1 alpha/beta hydrolase [Endobacterium cereale]MQY47760.1 alpha/beta hydrolase [Endobacterium cereale]